MSKPETTRAATPDDHGQADAHDVHDDHADGGETLGPIDVRAWGALALGVAAGLLVVLCLVITTTLLESATHV